MKLSFVTLNQLILVLIYISPPVISAIVSCPVYEAFSLWRLFFLQQEMSLLTHYATYVKSPHIECKNLTQIWRTRCAEYPISNNNVRFCDSAHVPQIDEMTHTF